MRESPLLLVLGPTASGKSQVAFEIARAVGGEIVSGDAFAVYRGLDIGTAKPPREMREAVAHHLLDVADPAESFSAGRWAGDARAAIEGIRRRGRVPIVAGGSHFYLRALLEGLPGDAVVSPSLRAYLSSRCGAEENARRKRMLELLDPDYSETVREADTARLSRAIEVIYSTGRRVSERLRPHPSWAEGAEVLKIALQIPRQDIYTRIDRRVMEMWRAGWAREVEGLLERNVSTSASSFRAIGYREVASFLAGERSEEQTLAEISRKTRSLVKRQRTWLSSEPGVVAVAPEAAVDTASRWLRGGGAHE
jgi:tRNA dimethylallyltransferase